MDLVNYAIYYIKITNLQIDSLWNKCKFVLDINNFNEITVSYCF